MTLTYEQAVAEKARRQKMSQGMSQPAQATSGRLPTGYFSGKEQQGRLSSGYFSGGTKETLQTETKPSSFRTEFRPFRGAVEPIMRAGERAYEGITAPSRGETSFGGALAGAFQPGQAKQALGESYSRFQSGADRFTGGLKKIGQGLKSIPSVLTGKELPPETSPFLLGLNDLAQGGFEASIGSIMPLVGEIPVVGKGVESLASGVMGALGGAAEGIPRGIGMAAGVSPEEPNIKAAGEFAQLIPGLSKGVIGKPLGLAGKGLKGVARKAAGKPFTEPIENVITETIEKHVKPSVRPKSQQELKSIREKEVGSAVDIFENRQNIRFKDKYGNEVKGETPSTVEEWAGATSNRFFDLFKEADVLSKQATGQGIKINISDIANKTLKELQSRLKVINIDRPEVASSILDNMVKWANVGKIKPDFLQDIIKEFNNKMRTVKENPSMAKMDELVGDTILLKNLREGLVESVAKIGEKGEQFKVLRQKMSQHKSLEDALYKRAYELAKKQGGGVLDMPDIFSAGVLAEALSQGNASLLARGITQLVGRKVQQTMFRDSDAAVARMFEKMKKRAGEKTAPTKTQKIGRALRTVAPAQTSSKED